MSHFVKTALAIAIVLALNTFASAQCGVQGRTFDQSNINLGNLLNSSAASAGTNSLAFCPTCQPPAATQPLGVPAAGPASASASAVAGGPAVDSANAQAMIAALTAQGYVVQSQQAYAYKPLRVGSSASSASASASAGDAYAYQPPVVQPQPVQPLMAYGYAVPVPVAPVALALPANAASSASASAVAGGADVAASGGCGGCGRQGIFRRAGRSRTRSVAVVNGQRSVSSSASVSR